ncbi:unnamed protein product [Lota lota]
MEQEGVVSCKEQCVGKVSCDRWLQLTLSGRGQSGEERGQEHKMANVTRLITTVHTQGPRWTVTADNRTTTTNQTVLVHGVLLAQGICQQENPIEMQRRSRIFRPTARFPGCRSPSASLGGSGR